MDMRDLYSDYLIFQKNIGFVTKNCKNEVRKQQGELIPQVHKTIQKSIGFLPVDAVLFVACGGV